MTAEISYQRSRFSLSLPPFREILARRLVALGFAILPDSNLVSFARRELELAGLFSRDSDYDGMLAEAAIALLKTFSLEGHSGFSAGLAISLFEKTSRFQPLTPLTGEDSEWTLLDYDERMTAQNKRCFSVFRRADGTAYDINGKVFREPSGTCFTSSASVVEVTFPYTPQTEYVDVPERNLLA